MCDVAYAEVPRTIHYQGKLTEPDGLPLVGEHTVTLRLYDAATAGTTLWEETHTITMARADNGLFNVVLGSVIPFGAAITFNAPLWLTTEVDEAGEFSPRQPLSAVGYAINADTLDGLDSTALLAGGGTAVELSAGSGLVAEATGLSLLRTCGVAQVLKWNALASAWECAADAEGGGSGTVSSVDSGAGLSGGPITGSGTLAVDVTTSGTTATTSANSGLDVSTDGLRLLGGCAANALLKWNATSEVWECATDVDTNSGGTVTSMTAGTGLTGGTITTSGTIGLAIPVSVASGGTGAATFTSGGLLIGQGTSALTTTGALAKGSLIVGDGAADPALLAVGGNHSILKADPAQTSGVKWAAGCMPLGGSDSTGRSGTFQMGVFGASDTKNRLDRLWPAPASGTVTSLRAFVNQAPGVGASWTVRLRKNAANATLTCTISGVATSCSAGGTDTFTAGDRMGVEFTETGTASSTLGSGWSGCFAPD